jgi:DMSO/TMAO reductase YedYZ heme-binding membrane subunit
MFDTSFLDISASLGLCATAVLILNFLLGMLLSTGYKANKYWKQLPVTIQQLNIERIHNFTAYLALALLFLHPFFLLLDKNAGFNFSHILLPLTAPKQAWIVLLGVVACYAIIIVIISSQKNIKKRLQFRVWKNIHLISYGTALLFLVHGLLMDPLLKDRPTDWFDPEKLLSEIGILVLVLASYFRYKYYVKKATRN